MRVKEGSHYDAVECERSNGGNLLLFMKNEQQQNPLKCRFIRGTKQEI